MDERGAVFWDFDGTLGFGPHGPSSWMPCLIEALDDLHPGHNVTTADLGRLTNSRYPWNNPDVAHTHLVSAAQWWAELEAVFREAFERRTQFCMRPRPIVPAMTTWTWSNPRWCDDVGNDVARSVREAVRRGVDLRDTLAESGREETSRALSLVDVLNYLAALSTWTPRSSGTRRSAPVGSHCAARPVGVSSVSAADGTVSR
jgi:hypothetical protein